MKDFVKAFFKRTVLFSYLALVFTSFTFCGGGGDSAVEPSPENQWTIMYYGDGDCDLEEDLLVDVEEMKEGFVDGQGINLIVLFDRHPAYSSDKSVFGEDFTDTRLYRITANTVWRLNGGSEFPEISKNGSYEANMGSGETLKKYQY